MSALAPDFRVIAPNLPFASPKDFSHLHSLRSYVDFLLEFADKLDLEKISIFGNSVGGTLGLLCCLENPNSFEKLIIRCPVWSRTQLPIFLRNQPLIHLHQWLSHNRAYALKIMKIFYYASARMSPAPILNNVDQSKNLLPFNPDQISPTILSSFLGHLLQVEIEPQLARISTETFILWGAHDNFIQSSWGRCLKKLLPNAKFREMPGEYHNIATVDIKRLAQNIVEFFG